MVNEHKHEDNRKHGVDVLLEYMWYSGGCLVFNWILEVGRKTAAQLPAAIPAVMVSGSEPGAPRQTQVSLWRAAAIADATHPPGLTCFSAVSL